MRGQKRYRTLSPPVDYWFLLTLFLSFILIILLFLLIKERLFWQNAQIYLEKYKINLNSFSSLNSQMLTSHLSQPTDPSSSSNIIYILPENFSYKLTQ
jgi:hypothetical protein